MRKSDSMGSDSRRTEHYGTPTQDLREEAQDEEMTRRIEEALSRFAIHGRVRLEGNFFVLSTPRGPIAIPAGAVPSRWADWSDSERRTKASDLAKDFVRKRDAEGPRLPSTRRAFIMPVGAIAAAFSCLLLGLAAFLWFEPKRKSPLPPADGTIQVQRARASGTDERSERAQRVCEATRARVARGATVNIADTDGWVVDLIALREAPKEPIQLESVLAPFLGQYTSGQKSRLIWPLEPELSAITADDAQVSVQPISFDGSKGHVEGVVLSFHGALIDSYFREDERVRYFHLATGFTEAFRATHAGLAARCEHERSYHLGSWFFGKTDATAATSLLFVLGYRGDPPQIAIPFRRAPGGVDDDGFAFSNIEQATQSLDRKILSAALGPNQGMAMGRSGESVVLTFAFQDGSAAARASRHLTRISRLGGD